ncbi:hypothetical protein NCCP1664_09440 [Zafaria cholistanensis]|uniref:TadE-like protein n=1 Tax=Zafaria cholistanensis TaxID=1682741 RepID=A0A5A7NR41_9MICC|nr:TadE family type IV pilus minor pilin [Zafaria cholistanensis]GER22447.1 hypothetical protein NCCP1664_09440 [Zafaria cholistanensis]
MHLSRQRGSSTAEVAVLLPGIALLVALAVGAGSLGATQVRLEQAARAAARELARGEASATAHQTARRLAGDGVTVGISGGDRFRTVRVSVGIGLPVPGGGSGFVLTAEASARSEQE